jgi:hypothetical protein
MRAVEAGSRRCKLSNEELKREDFFNPSFDYPYQV